MKLLRFTLTNSYFNYNKKTYKQIHGCAMGSPVSPIVVNLCMEEIEDTALKNLTCHLGNGFAMSMMSFLSLRNMR